MRAMAAAVFPLILAIESLVPGISRAADWTEQDLATAAALRDQALAGTQAFDHVSSLVTEVGPRFAGSAGDAAAVRWAVNKLGSLGFEKVRSQDVLVPHWVRGSAEVSILSPSPQPLEAVALGGSVGTPEEGIEAPVLAVASLDALKALSPGAANGKIVFIDQRMPKTQDVSGYASTVGIRVQGPSIAADLGASALVIRSVGTSPDRFAHTGSLVYRTDAPRIPAFALSNPDADVLARQAQGSKPVRLRLHSTSRELPPAWSANVIGEITGTDRASEIVLLGAHLDSWDLGQGAIDDGAGVAISMAAAKLIGDLPQAPARTIRVVAFANEEQGLHGGFAYAKAHSGEIARHAMMAESDFGAGRIYGFDAGNVSDGAREAVQQIAKVLEPLGIAWMPGKGDPESDIGPFAQQGAAWAWLGHDGTDYFDLHHTPDDTLDKIDPKALAQNAAAYAVFTYLAAEAEGGFGSAPKPAAR